MLTRVSLAVLAGASIIVPHASAQNLFPGRADDLRPGEAWYWGQAVHPSGASQGKGHDLGIVAFDPDSETYLDCVQNGKLTACNDDMANEDHLIYNQPVFASAAGTVVRCWRNAPENPDPPNLHDDFERIIGGGNFLFVQDAAGDSILYAHLIPGSIPETLCPNDDTFARAAANIITESFAPDTDGDVPVADQVTVQAGDFLGCVGNSGSSSGTHLHIHKVAGLSLGSNAYGPPLDLPFESFRWNTVPPGENWISAASNAVLPSGPIVILPPAQDPTFAPTAWITADLADFQDKRAAWGADGLGIHDFESYLSDAGTRLYAGIFRPMGGPQEFLVDLQWDRFFNEWQKLERRGFRIDDFESYELGPIRVYSGVFNQGDFPPSALINYDWPNFLSAWSSIEAQGYRLHDHEIYRIDGRWVYSGIFKPDTYVPFAHFGQPFGEFLEAWRSAERQGYFLHDLEVYRSGEGLRYNGVFRPGRQNRGAWINQPWKGFLQKWGEFEDANYRIHDFEGHDHGSANTNERMFSGIFLRSRTPSPCDFSD